MRIKKCQVEKQRYRRIDRIAGKNWEGNSVNTEKNTVYFSCLVHPNPEREEKVMDGFTMVQ